MKLASLKLALISLGALLFSLGLFSAALADDKVPASPAISSASDAQVQPTAQAEVQVPDALRLETTANASTATPLSTAGTAAACPSGQAWTCCSCGCGCRRNTISPQNFCRFFFCPGP